MSVQLSREIKEFQAKNEQTMNQCFQHMNQIINILSEKLKTIDPNGGKIEVYGSFATKLCLPFSDIDLLIDTERSSERVLQDLNKLL